jgi:hypothetical protein
LFSYWLSLLIWVWWWLGKGGWIGKGCIAYDGVWVTTHWDHLAVGHRIMDLGWKVGYDTDLHRILLCFGHWLESWDGWMDGYITMIPRAWTRRLQLEFHLPLACTTSHKSLAALAKQNENTSEHRSVTSPHTRPSCCVSRKQSPVAQLNCVSPSRLRCHTHRIHLVSETKALPSSGPQEHCPV